MEQKISVLGMAFLALLVCKGLGIIAWPWSAIFAPLWVGLPVLFTVTAMAHLKAINASVPDELTKEEKIILLDSLQGSSLADLRPEFQDIIVTEFGNFDNFLIHLEREIEKDC